MTIPATFWSFIIILRFTGALAGLSDLIAGQSGAMGTDFAIILIALAIIAIAIVIIILRFG